jgi:hypothetical protein
LSCGVFPSLARETDLFFSSPLPKCLVSRISCYHLP